MVVKKRVFILFAVMVTVALALPSVSLAATANEKKLDALKAGGISAYDVSVPKRGKKQTKAQLKALLKKLPSKVSGKGNCEYSYALAFYDGVNDGTRGKYRVANKEKMWSKHDGTGQNMKGYWEAKYFLSEDREELGVTNCGLLIIDKANIYTYSWIKGAKVGQGYKTDYTDPLNIALSYVVYPDAVVLGQKCLVYSIETEGSKVYTYISRSTGQIMKVITSGQGWPTVTTIYFARYKTNKADSYFKKPSGVKIKTHVIP